LTRKIRLTLPAEQDVAKILDDSASTFGVAARSRYEALLQAAIEDLRTNPRRPTSADRPDLGLGVRSYHLRFARRRAGKGAEKVRSPRHLLVYVIESESEVLILRVLYDAMDLRMHLAPETA
jgi:toxin ParE1/3/4